MFISVGSVVAASRGPPEMIIHGLMGPSKSEKIGSGSQASVFGQIDTSLLTAFLGGLSTR